MLPDARLMLPIWIDITNVTMAILTAWPIIRIVASDDAATPYRFLSTEPMMALLLGEEKKGEAEADKG